MFFASSVTEQRSASSYRSLHIFYSPSLFPLYSVSPSLPIASLQIHTSGHYFKIPFWLLLPSASTVPLHAPSFQSHCLLQRFLGFSSHPGPSQVPGRGGGGAAAALAGAGVSALLLTLLSRAGSSCEIAFSIFSRRQPPDQLQW